MITKKEVDNYFTDKKQLIDFLNELNIDVKNRFFDHDKILNSVHALLTNFYPEINDINSLAQFKNALSQKKSNNDSSALALWINHAIDTIRSNKGGVAFSNQINALFNEDIFPGNHAINQFSINCISSTNNNLSVEMGSGAYMSYMILSQGILLGPSKIKGLQLFFHEFCDRMEKYQFSHESFIGLKDRKLLEATAYVLEKIAVKKNQLPIDDKIMREHIESIGYLMHYIPYKAQEKLYHQFQDMVHLYIDEFSSWVQSKDQINSKQYGVSIRKMSFIEKLCDNFSSKIKRGCKAQIKQTFLACDEKSKKIWLDVLLRSIYCRADFSQMEQLSHIAPLVTEWKPNLSILRHLKSKQFAQNNHQVRQFVASMESIHLQKKLSTQLKSKNQNKTIATPRI